MAQAVRLGHIVKLLHLGLVGESSGDGAKKGKRGPN